MFYRRIRNECDQNSRDLPLRLKRFVKCVVEVKSHVNDVTQTPKSRVMSMFKITRNANVAIQSRSRHLRPLLQREQSADITVELHHHG